MVKILFCLVRSTVNEFYNESFQWENLFEKILSKKYEHTNTWNY